MPFSVPIAHNFTPAGLTVFAVTAGVVFPILALEGRKPRV